MNIFIAEFHQTAISAQANLRKQVKPQGGGRSQNNSLMKGLPI
jgi:hypothetical protein